MNNFLPAAPSLGFQTLVSGLTSLSPEQSRVSRLLFNHKIVPWLTSTLALPPLKVSQSQEAMTGTCFDITCALGKFRLCVDLSAFPALRMATEMTQRSTAHAVANVLLASVSQSLSSVTGELHIQHIDLEAASHNVIGRIHHAGADIALIDCDNELLGNFFRSFPNDASLSSEQQILLTLPAQLELMRHHWTLGFLRSVNTGDVVLLPDKADVQLQSYWRLRVGAGSVWNCNVIINFEDQNMTIASPPEFDQHGEAEISMTASMLDQLHVPIAFEIDTARLTLAELASMRPGYTIELNLPLTQATVRLSCHGQTVGTGQLVAIGEQLGVRISRMDCQHVPSAEH